jgi:hypothetical protein
VKSSVSEEKCRAWEVARHKVQIPESCWLSKVVPHGENKTVHVLQNSDDDSDYDSTFTNIKVYVKKKKKGKKEQLAHKPFKNYAYVLKHIQCINISSLHMKLKSIVNS